MAINKAKTIAMIKHKHPDKIATLLHNIYYHNQSKRYIAKNQAMTTKEPKSAG